jgi:hypothetical protein
MNKQERKQILRAMELQAEVKAELEKERVIGEDMHFQGIGVTVLQIAQFSPTGEGAIWDVRTIHDEYRAYVSYINPERPGYLLPGYRLLDIESDVLIGIAKRLSQISLASLVPEIENMGLGGTTTRVSLRRGFAKADFTWWESGPPEWRDLTKSVESTIVQFFAAPNSPLHADAYGAGELSR